MVILIGTLYLVLFLVTPFIGGAITVAVPYLLIFGFNKKLTIEKKVRVKNVVIIFLSVSYYLVILITLLIHDGYINFVLIGPSVGIILILSLLSILCGWFFVRYILRRYNQGVLLKKIIFTNFLDAILATDIGLAVGCILIPLFNDPCDNGACFVGLLEMMYGCMFIFGLGGMISSFYFIKKCVLNITKT